MKNINRTDLCGELGGFALGYAGGKVLDKFISKVIQVSGGNLIVLGKPLGKGFAPKF